MDYIVIYSEKYSDGDEKPKQITTVSLPDTEHNVADAIAMLLGGRYGIRIWYYAEATPSNVRKLETRFEEYMREEREEEERRRASAERLHAELERRNEQERRTVGYWLKDETVQGIIKVGIVIGLVWIWFHFFV